MSKRSKHVAEEGGLDAMARLRDQDDKFCRMVRAAVEMGRESCPIRVSTAPCTKRPVSNYTRPD